MSADLIEHLEGYEYDAGEFWLAKTMPDGASLELKFRHSMGEKSYTVEVYRDGEEIGRLWEGME